MRDVYVKQLQAQLGSPRFYGLMLAASLLAGLNLFSGMLALSAATTAAPNQLNVLVGSLFLNLSLLMIMICPLISASLFASDAQLKHLSDAPAELGGQYLAALSAVALLAAIGPLLCLAVEFVADLDWGLVLSCYLGLMLLTACFLALGLAARVLISSRLVAALVTLMLILALLAIGRLGSIIQPRGLGLVMHEAGLGTHLSAFLKGELRLKDMAYYLFVTVFCLSLSRRLLAGAHMKRPGSFSRLAALAAVLVLVYLSLWIRDPRCDLTAARRNSLNPQTVALLCDLKQDACLTIFDGPASIPDWLVRCRRASARFSYRRLDPRRLGLSGAPAVLEQAGRSVALARLDEQSLRTALRRVAAPRLVCFSRGHAERRLTDDGPGGLSRLRESLARAGYDLREVDLESEPVPTRAFALVIAGPSESFAPRAVSALEAFLAGGGAIVLAIDPGHAGGLGRLLSSRGIACPDNLVIDPDSRILGGADAMPAVSRYAGLATLEDFHYTAFFPRARAFELKTGAGLNLTPLAQSGASSWAETDIAGLERLGRASRSVSEPAGPLALAVLARSGRGRLLVFGDSDFMTNAHLSVSGNGLLLLACLEGLSAEAAQVVDEPQAAAKSMILSRQQVNLLLWLTVVLLPAFALAGLIGTFIRGRRKCVRVP